jgi:glutaredoxin 3
MTAIPSVEIYTSRYCPYCKAAKLLLARKKVPFNEIDIAANAERLDEMISRSGGVATVPQIFIRGAHIGDGRALDDLERRGELDRLLGLVQSN